MASPVITVALFDLGGVLFHYEPARRWQDFADLAGLTPDVAEKRLSTSGYAMACDQGRYRGQRAYAEGVRALGTRISRERFTHAWVSAFRPDERVLEIALEVQKRASIALFSNSSDLAREGLEALWPAVLAPFMPRIFSADLGLTKPDPRAYLQAAALLERTPEEVLVIDAAPANTASAASLGFPAVHFRAPDELVDALRGHGLL